MYRLPLQPLPTLTTENGLNSFNRSTTLRISTFKICRFHWSARPTCLFQVSSRWKDSGHRGAAYRSSTVWDSAVISLKTQHESNALQNLVPLRLVWKHSAPFSTWALTALVWPTDGSCAMLEATRFLFVPSPPTVFKIYNKWNICRETCEMKLAPRYDPMFIWVPTFLTMQLKSF